MPAAVVSPEIQEREPIRTKDIFHQTEIARSFLDPARKNRILLFRKSMMLILYVTTDGGRVSRARAKQEAGLGAKTEKIRDFAV